MICKTCRFCRYNAALRHYTCNGWRLPDLRGCKRWEARYSSDSDRLPDASDGFWRNPDWLWCRDEKWRPVEPGLEPLVDGLPERVGLLRGYGNAIVPQVAAKMIKAYVETINDN